MSTPLIETIAVALETAIDAITVANGFNQTLVGYRPQRSDYLAVSPVDGTVMLKQADDEIIEWGGTTGTTLLETIFNCKAVIVKSDSDAGKLGTYRNQVAGDIWKKVMTDPTFGGLAIDTRIAAIKPYADEPDITGVIVDLAIQYRVDIENPYTQA